MVTDANHPLEAIGQLYPDRADCENGFDGLKNQWGLSGFTTQDINRCQTTARAKALLQSRQPDSKDGGHHKKAPAAGGGGAGRAQRRADNALPDTDAWQARMLKRLIANIHAALQHVKAAAEQFKSVDRWAVLLRYVSHKIAPTLGPLWPFAGLAATRQLPDLGSCMV